jgi:hypothetical protein
MDKNSSQHPTNWCRETPDVRGAYSCQLDFRAFNWMVNAMSVEERQGAERWIATVGECIAGERYVDALRELHSRVGLRAVVPLREEAFFQRNALFAYAHLLGYQGRRSEALDAMDASGVTWACAVSDLPLHVHDLAARACLDEQNDAMRRNVPSILIVSLPRSASAFLSDVLRRLLGMAELRTSFCDPPFTVVFLPWLKAFLRGGAITHEHYAATRENLESLMQAGVKRIFVQVRDPRAAAYSLHTMVKAFDVNPRQPDLDFVTTVRTNADWIEGWLRCREKTNVEIEFLDYSSVVGDTKAVVERILTAYGLAERANRIGPFLERTPPNFARGDNDAWREQCSRDAIEQCWRAIPAAVADLLNLRR